MRKVQNLIHLQHVNLRSNMISDTTSINHLQNNLKFLQQLCILENPVEDFLQNVYV